VQACVRAAREEGIDVVWTGLGGDQLFEGSPRGASSLVWRGRPLAAIALARAFAPRSLTGQARSIAANVAWASLRRHLPVRLLTAVSRRPPSVMLRPWAGPRLRALEEARIARARRARPPWEISRREKTARSLRADFCDMLAFDRSVLEARGDVLRLDPYMDPEIVRAVASLPDDELVREGIPRWPLREAVRGLVPEEVRLRRDKASFERACIAMFRGVPIERWRGLATPTALGDLGLLEPKRFRDEYDAFEADLAGNPEGWLRVWPVLACEAFVRGVEKLPGRFPGGAS
jgi:asparagine synthase (glutamine-hydrolysing)